MSHLSVDKLAKRFSLHMLGSRELSALETVSFDVDEGELLAVVGRSGSGKSSLLRCVYRSYLPSSGSLVYWSEDGPVDLARLDDRSMLALRRAEIGYVSQFLSAVPRTSARAVVAEPLLVRGIASNEAGGRADVMLESLGMSAELRESFPATMSGGERQRVNLARALIAQPRMLLLDEPTSALDPETRRLAIDAIRVLARRGTTMIAVLHDRETLEALADRVLALEHGRVAWDRDARCAHEPLAEA
jgi:alpha-D-ribose 1-methylphosphonate 5-triphosphate synthase subunit PhnL